MRIGIFGGTFNPPHLAHLILVECARDELELDRVLLVLAPRPPHKQVDGDPGPEERLELCRAAVAGEQGRIEVSDVELHRDGLSYTADTLAELHEQHPADEFVLLLGGDSAAGLASWHRPNDILRYAEIGVAARGDDDHARAARTLSGLGAADRLRPFSMPRVDISSTLIRDRIRAGRTIHHLVPDAVEARVRAQGLYRGGTHA